MSAFPYPAHPLSPYPPLIINAALTGMAGSRERVAHLPVSTEQIVVDAERCVAAGASIVHLHARASDGRPEWRRGAYAEIVEGVRERCPEVVVCVTTSGREVSDVDLRGDVLRLTGDARPDMASLTLGSLNFSSGPSVNAIATVEELADRMLAAGIMPELEIFDLGMAHLAHRLIARELIGAAPYANLMLGFPNGAAADARSLVALVEALPAQTTWAVAGFGAFQRPAGGLSIVMGGHVRTGLEDNPYTDHVTREPATNAGHVTGVAAVAAALGRAVATPRQTRELLGISRVAPAAQR